MKKECETQFEDNVDARECVLVADPVGRLLTIDDLVAEVRLSRAMIYRRMRARDNPFPPPIKFGKASRWSFVEIVEWKKRTAEMRGNVGQVWKRI